MSRESYERLPYPTGPHIESHPAAMETVATSMGLRPPAVATARVLELGCATGGNIVPMAAGVPTATFVGIDFSPSQIEQASTFARAVGADNLTLLTKSILDINKDFGQFDYIIAHGIYSWVSEEVREKVLSICRENLSDNGVAFISFNCQPGWLLSQWLREFALTAAPGGDLAAIKTAVDLVLESPKLQASALGPAVRRAADKYKLAPESQWMHDLLEDNSHPVYFSEFAARADAHKLIYLAEATSNSTLAEVRHPQSKALLDSAGDDWVRREQLLDFLRSNPFRRALLVKREQSFDRKSIGGSLENFFVSSPLKPQAEGDALRDSQVVKFQEPGGAGLSTGLPLTKTALSMLCAMFPASMRLSEVLERSAAELKFSRADLAAARQRTIDEFATAWTMGILDARVTPAPIVLEAGDLPEIWSVARYQASIGQPTLTNLRHEVVNLDTSNHTLIAIVQLLDGTRTREQLVEQLAEAVSRPIKELRPQAMDTIEQILKAAGRLAILVR